MKKTTNIAGFKTTLPYASEIFGVYQPLLGWKSKRTEKRINKGLNSDKSILIAKLYDKFRGIYKLSVNQDNHFEGIEKLTIGELKGPQKNFDLTVLKEIAKELLPLVEMSGDAWLRLINRERLTKLLNDVVKPEIKQWYMSEVEPMHVSAQGVNRQLQLTKIVEERVNRESIVAGILLELQEAKLFSHLTNIFYKENFQIEALLNLVRFEDPFDTIDPKKDLDRVGLSPIGIVHLFRQYFFEFDSFLGSPVGHIWLTPGSTVELIEISTRKTIVEKTLEMQTESIIKTEKSVTDQDEISEAVKEDNKNDTKFGANVNASQNWVWGSANESSSFDMNKTQQTAREQTHKHMRQQSEKLSTEIRKNYKSTFKTITEVTDTTSKRYVLTNGGTELVNYELRRKMRQVGVQVQDIGTYLCWQTYVDEPGKNLGVAKLMHIAKSPELDKIPQPEQIVPQQSFNEKVNIQIAFVGLDTDDNDQAYTDGSETEVAAAFDATEHIESNFPQKATCKEANYYLESISLQPQGADVKASIRDFVVNTNSNSSSFTVHLDYVNFHEQNTINIEATLNWKPNQDENAIKTENQKRLGKFTATLENEYKKSFVEAAQERIKIASNIQPRPYEDLREEERIVVYRKLIQEMLAPDKIIPQPDFRTRHIVSELINSIFDVDKMLYFVAPEWWRPKQHYHQSFGTAKPTGNIGKDGLPEMLPDLTNNITDENIVGWGGINEMRENNYYITENSSPAKLGSSLGWLLQLDGDNLRNAFLNAPWVKAVIPIRPGKEKAALNWLQQVEGMNGITPADIYSGTEPELQGKTMFEVLNILAEKIQEKHKESNTTHDIPDPDNPTDTANTVSATPVDKVYEHGFYPLQGGFRSNVGTDFEIFDQWIEILPTDQVVAVAVKYDPITGKQVPLI
jgi:hypothetical protein